MDSGISPLQNSQRLLAAIVLTDAVGFSARMSENEEKALITINRDLKHIAELGELFEGQVLKSTGDGLLMCFFSAVQAVSCALAVQKNFASFAESSEHFTHRIGIHLGDVYLNNSDVMGNGVNIAARLETACKPGEVCVSKVVYDVVKSCLNLNTTFLGPLHLKNIQEEVPAYQIHGAIDADPIVLFRDRQADKEITQPLNSDLTEQQYGIAKVAQSLEHHSNSLRIKKLIFSTSQNLWENDPTMLDQFSLEGLIGTLLQRNPTPDHCKASLYKVVATLNRKTEYAQVAEIVLTALKPLFSKPAGEMTSGSREETNSTKSVTQLGSGYQAIADCLDRDAQALRIKKVLYCLCYQEWENNCDRIAHLDTSVLVEQLHQLAPTPQELKYRLHYLLQRLNRKSQYTPVMETLFSHCQVLYQQGVDKTQVALPALEPNDSAGGMQTCFNTATPAALHPEATVAHIPQPVEAPAAAVSPSIKDRSDLFELRLDIIKYCNPLRAKILLFSVLNGPFSDSPRDWSKLQALTLEDLLRQVFDYCSTFEDLEGKLTILAHCLEDVEESNQAVSAITHAIKGYYPPPKPKAQPRRHRPASKAAQKTSPKSAQNPLHKVAAKACSMTTMSPVTVYG